MLIVKNELHLIEDGKLPEQRWKDTMTPRSINVIVWYLVDGNKLFCAGYYDYNACMWRDSGDDGEIQDVTHWQRVVAP